jgi:tetratricopeptide (TPR) repeat protein
MVFANFSFPSERPFHSIVLMTVFGLAASGNRFALKKRYVMLLSVIVLMVLSLTAYDLHIRHETEKTLHKMYALWGKGDWQGVAKLTENYSWLSNMNFSGDPIPYYNGVAWLQMNDTEKAFESFKKALIISPYHPLSMVNLGACCNEKKMYDESLACYRLAAYYYPDYQVARNGVALVSYVKERM